MSLGIDLKGGVEILLQVDFKSYFDEIYQLLEQDIIFELKQNGLRFHNINHSNKAIFFSLLSIGESMKDLEKIKNKIDPNLRINIEKDLVSFAFPEEYIKDTKNKIIEKSSDIIRTRLDIWGTKEISLQRQGSENILLQIPGLQENTIEIRNLLNQVAKLTFHLVEEDNIEKVTKSKLINPKYKLVELVDENTSLLIEKKILLTGESIEYARLDFNEYNIPVVAFSFTPAGSKIFAKITSENIGRRLAILLDGKVITAPVVNQAIIGGNSVISGKFSITSATKLATLIQSGSLPAKFDILEERVIGPSLGSDSIENGKLSALIGFILVALLMILLYGVLGIIANISLILTLSYIITFLTITQATLTFPGIAGIILTIGMAVDANVLVYERIKEELRKNKSNEYSVYLGFKNAFVTILDSNVTSFIATLILYIFGTGPVQGFAVTLAIGTVSSMFSALVVNKLLINIFIKYFKPSQNLGLNI